VMEGIDGIVRISIQLIQVRPPSLHSVIQR
jgi:hypothetical protein